MRFCRLAKIQRRLSPGSRPWRRSRLIQTAQLKNVYTLKFILSRLEQHGLRPRKRPSGWRDSSDSLTPLPWANANLVKKSLLAKLRERKFENDLLERSFRRTRSGMWHGFMEKAFSDDLYRKPAQRARWRGN